MLNDRIHSVAVTSILNTVVPVGVNYARKDVSIKLQTKREIDLGS